MLGAVIYPVIGAGGSVEPELALEHVAAKPAEPHIHVLGAIGDNGAIGDYHIGGIVGLNRRPPLGPFHLN